MLSKDILVPTPAPFPRSPFSTFLSDVGPNLGGPPVMSLLTAHGLHVDLGVLNILFVSFTSL